MSIKISVKNSLNLKSVKNHVIFTNQDFRNNDLSKLPLAQFSSFISKSVSASDLKKKKFFIIQY